MSETETLEKLREFDEQIIHGPRTFGKMADCVEGLILSLNQYKAIAEQLAEQLQHAWDDEFGVANLPKVREVLDAFNQLTSKEDK